MFKHFSYVISLRLHYIQDKYQVFLAQQFAYIIQVEKHYTDKLMHVCLNCCRQNPPFARPKRHSIISILLRKLLQRHEPELKGQTRFLVVCLAFIFCCEPCARCEIRQDKAPYIFLISAAFDVPWYIRTTAFEVFSFWRHTKKVMPHAQQSQQSDRAPT